MRILFVLLAMASFTAGIHPAPPQGSAKQLVGTWKLISATSTAISGEINHAAFGPHPSGYLTLTADNRMSFIAADDGRRPLSILDRVTAPTEERAQAFATFVAYAGTYTFASPTLTYHVKVSSIQNWANSDLIRTVRLHNSQLSLTTPPTRKGGVTQTIQLVFQKIDK